MNVTDEGGTPIDAVVLVTTYHPGNIVSSSFRARNGAVVMRDAPSGYTSIVARAEGLAPAATSLEISPGGSHGPLPIGLVKAATIRGLVFDRDGTRQPDASVIIEYPDLPFARTLANYASRRTSGDADFEIRNVVPRVAVRVFAQHQGRRSAVSTVVLGVGEEHNMLLLLE